MKFTNFKSDELFPFLLFSTPYPKAPVIYCHHFAYIISFPLSSLLEFQI
jgi:hypothetical protein